MSGEVVAIGRLGTPDFRNIARLSRAAIERAITSTTADLRALNRSTAIVPKDTGLLQSSFVVSPTPGQIAMKWSANPTGTFDYAKVQDEGRPGMRGWNFSGTMLKAAKELLRMYLKIELDAIQP